MTELGGGAVAAESPIGKEMIPSDQWCAPLLEGRERGGGWDSFGPVGGSATRAFLLQLLQIRLLTALGSEPPA